MHNLLVMLFITKFLVKTSQFKFLVMTAFYEKITTPSLKKVTPLFPLNPNPL